MSQSPKKRWNEILNCEIGKFLITAFKTYLNVRHLLNGLHHTKINHEFTREAGLNWITFE